MSKDESIYSIRLHTNLQDELFLLFAPPVFLTCFVSESDSDELELEDSEEAIQIISIPIDIDWDVSLTFRLRCRSDVSHL